METAMECDCDAAAAEIIVGSVSSDSSCVEKTPSPPPEKKPKLNPIDVLLLKATDAAPCIESPKQHHFSSDSSSSSHDSKSPTPPSPKKKASSGQYYESGDECDSEEVKQYLKMVEESDGFDVEGMDSYYGFGIIVPFGPINETMMVEFTKYANLALADYNAKHGTDFKCAKIIKANWQSACMILYYLTFEVKSDGVPDHDHSPNQIFQAEVLHGVTTDTVELCRPKPNP